MKTLIYAWGMARRHLLYALNSPKVWAGILLVLSSVLTLVTPFVRSAYAFGETVSVGIIAYNFSAHKSILKIFIALLFIFSELPFKDMGQNFIVIRGGKRAWYLSQIIYVFCVSALLILIISLFSIIPLIGKLNFKNSWGIIHKNAANFSPATAQFNISASVSDAALNAVSPYAALAWSLPVGVLLMFVFGNIIMSLNSLSRGGYIGTVAGIILISLYLFKSFVAFPWYDNFTIIEWAGFTPKSGEGAKPAVVITTLFCLLLISAIITAIRSRKKSDLNIR